VLRGNFPLPGSSRENGHSGCRSDLCYPPPMTRFENLFIGIAGMIGAGKSTLATALGKHLDIDVYYEPVDNNEYLADFYRDTKRYSFATQIYLLNRRFQQHQEIIWRGRSAVQDRTIYEDSIFAKMLAKTGLMEERDYRTYIDLFRNMSNFMCKPNVIIYLDVSPERSMERIKARSRGVESGITIEYLKALHDGYAEFVADISRVIPVIQVDYDRFPTVEEMARVILSDYLDHSFLREATRFDPTR
jgi:deoxyadenosine kinase